MHARLRPSSGPLPALTSRTWLFTDPDVVSLEAADRPNFFLHVPANGSLELAKWQGSAAFHRRASFSLHRGTWQAGLVALESLAEPGSFLYGSGPSLVLRLYEHTEVFRRSTLFRLLGRCVHPTSASAPPHTALPALSHRTLPAAPKRQNSHSPGKGTPHLGAAPKMGGGLTSMLVAWGAVGCGAWGPASFLGPAYTHRPITWSKNRAAFVDTR